MHGYNSKLFNLRISQTKKEIVLNPYNVIWLTCPVTDEDIALCRENILKEKDDNTKYKRNNKMKRRLFLSLLIATMMNQSHGMEDYDPTKYRAYKGIQKTEREVREIQKEVSLMDQEEGRVFKSSLLRNLSSETFDFEETRFMVSPSEIQLRPSSSFSLLQRMNNITSELNELSHRYEKVRIKTTASPSSPKESSRNSESIVSTTPVAIEK
jgi:hypothetical protein